MSTFQIQIATLKNQMINVDLFGDYDDLVEKYFSLIDSITNENKIEQLEENFKADDLFFSMDPYEISANF